MAFRVSAPCSIGPFTCFVRASMAVVPSPRDKPSLRGHRLPLGSGAQQRNMVWPPIVRNHSVTAPRRAVHRYMAPANQDSQTSCAACYTTVTISTVRYQSINEAIMHQRIKKDHTRLDFRYPTTKSNARSRTQNE